MNDSDIIDDEEIEEGVVLYSKFSVILVLLLFSPILAGFIYCINLKRIKLQDKIVSTYLSILMIQLPANLPFMGFKLKLYEINLIPFFSSLVMVGFLAGPMWNRHFYNVKFRSIFPTKAFLIMSGIYALSIIYEYWLIANKSQYDSIPSYFYLFNFSLASTWMIFFYLLLGRLIYILFFMQKKVQKANTPNNISTEN